MSEEKTPQGGNSPSEGGKGSTADEPAKLFTQEQVNSMVGKTRAEERAKYADYDKYKQAYEEAQAKADAEKSEMQKTMERLNAAESELNQLKAEKERSAWIADVSKETGVPAAALHGNTKEEVQACADALKTYFEKPAAPVTKFGEPSKDANAGDPLRNAINGIL